MNKIESKDIFDKVIEILKDNEDKKTPIFRKMIDNYYNNICIIIPALYHKDKFELIGDKELKIIDEEISKNEITFIIYNDFFIPEDIASKDTSSYRSFMYKIARIPDDKNRNRKKEEKDVVYAGCRVYFKPYD